MPRLRRCPVFAMLLTIIVASLSRSANSQAPAAAAAAAAAQDEAQARAALEQALRAQQEGDVLQGGGGRGRGVRGGGRSGGGRGNPIDPSTGQPVFSRNSGQRIGNVEALAIDQLSSTEPQELIGLNLWVLTIDMPRAKAADDLTASVVSRASDLPNVLGSRDDVRVLIGKLTVAGVLLRSREFRVSAVSGQAVSIQSGANQPQITASQMLNAARGGGRGGRVNQIQYQSVGTTISLQPRVVAGGNIDVQLNYSSSDQEDDHSVALAEDENGNRVPASRTVTQQVQTTSRVKGGSAVLVQSDVLSEPTNNEASSVRTQLVILGANIIPSAAE